MDNYNYQQYDNYQQHDDYHKDKRSDGLATAALVLGIAGLLCSITIILPLICGSLAIILAILSKGGELTTAGKGKAGMILGIISACIGAFILLLAIATTSSTSFIDEFEREYKRQMDQYYNGYDYDDYYNDYDSDDIWNDLYDDNTF